MKFLFLRIILPLLLFLIVRAVVKAVFASRAPAERPIEPTRVPAGGELKKDPVCGTFVAAAGSVQKKVGKETVYFCSEECRGKFRG
jgi:YHS domain-containing protein